MRDGKRDVVDCARSCARGEESGFRIVVTVINVDTSSLRTIPSYELKNDSTLQSMFAEHGSARRRGALRRAAMERGRFTPPISPSVKLFRCWLEASLYVILLCASMKAQQIMSSGYLVLNL